MNKIIWPNDIKKNLLEELWENAAFLTDSFEQFKNYIQAFVHNSKSSRESYDGPYLNLSTIRNRYLINDKEQEKLQKTVVAFFGLSVGSHAALTWMMQSRAEVIKIADPQRIRTSNLNRIRVGWKSIGKKKVDVIEQQLKEINPFAQIIKLSKTDKLNMENFCVDPRVNLIVDAVDDLESKYILRLIAKKNRIPILMATDVGDNVFLDIERYDLDEDLELFLGRVPEIYNVDFDYLNLKDRLRLVFKIVGFTHHSSRMLWSLAHIGEEIKTWPQLGATATIAGGIITTAIKKIVLGESIMSGRYYLSLDNLLSKDYNRKKERVKRNVLIKKIRLSLL